MTIAGALKSMMVRVGRKEAKALLLPLHGSVTQLRKDLLTIRNRLMALERLADRMARRELLQPRLLSAEREDGAGDVFTVHRMRSLRKRLRLSRRKFGALLGVSGQAVYNWEKKSGRLRLRHATRQAVRRLQQMGVAQARDELALITGGKTVNRREVKRRRKKTGARS